MIEGDKALKGESTNFQPYILQLNSNRTNDVSLLNCYIFVLKL